MWVFKDNWSKEDTLVAAIVSAAIVFAMGVGGSEFFSSMVTDENPITQWILAFTGVLAVGLLFRTLQETRQTLVLTESAKNAAWATVKETTRIGEAQTRAYLFPDDCYIDFDQEHELICIITFAAIGNTPAKDIKYRYKVAGWGDITNKEIRRELDALDTENPWEFVGGKEANGKGFVFPFNHHNLKQCIKDAVGKFEFAVYGHIFYKDVFNKSCFSEFAFMTLGDFKGTRQRMARIKINLAVCEIVKDPKTDALEKGTIKGNP